MGMNIDRSCTTKEKNNKNKINYNKKKKICKYFNETMMRHAKKAKK